MIHSFLDKRKIFVARMILSWKKKKIIVLKMTFFEDDFFFEDGFLSWNWFYEIWYFGFRYHEPYIYRRCMYRSWYQPSDSSQLTPIQPSSGCHEAPRQLVLDDPVVSNVFPQTTQWQAVRFLPSLISPDGHPSPPASSGVVPSPSRQMTVLLVHSLPSPLGCLL